MDSGTETLLGNETPAKPVAACRSTVAQGDDTVVTELRLEKLNKHPNNKHFSCLFFIKLKCCGIVNFTDWADSKWQEKNKLLEVPLSCCKEGGNTTTCNSERGFDASKINQEVISYN